MSILSVEKPPSFVALQVYRPSSFFVMLVRSRDILFPLSVSFLNQDNLGLGKPASILQVRLTLSPSLMRLLGLGTYTIGRTKREKNKEKHRLNTNVTQLEDCKYIYCKAHYNNKGITWLFEGILFICARVVSFAARAQRGTANDTTRAQINNILEKSHFIIIIINIQGQILSRYLTSFAQFLMKTSRSQYIELKIRNWTSVVFASTKSVILLITNRKRKNKQPQYKTLPISKIYDSCL